jgi:hypothetical protein
LSHITSMILSIAKFLISDFEKVFNMKFVGMCMIYLHANFYMSVLNSSVVVAVVSTQKTKYNFMQPSFYCLTITRTHTPVRACSLHLLTSVTHLTHSVTLSLSLSPPLPSLSNKR